MVRIAVIVRKDLPLQQETVRPAQIKKIRNESNSRLLLLQTWSMRSLLCRVNRFGMDERAESRNLTGTLLAEKELRGGRRGTAVREMFGVGSLTCSDSNARSDEMR